MPLTAQANEPLLSFRSFEPSPPVTVSQWADANQIVTLGPARGQWSTAKTPYLRDLMDALSDPTVEKVTVRAASQVGKTQVLRNFIGYVIDHDPAEMLVVMPDIDDAKAWAAKHIRSMAQHCPAIRQHTTGKEDDLAGDYYQFDRMYIKLAGAGSPADLASDSCRYVLFDEVDKFPKWSGNEADPLSLGEKRARNFWNRKIIKVSTPVLETDFITVEYNQSDRRKLWVPCPVCGEFQALNFRQEDDGPITGRIVWPDNATPDEIRDQRLARFECGHCDAETHEGHKEQMIASSVWCPEGLKVDHYGRISGLQPTRHRGYHLPVFASPWVSWSETVHDFLKANKAMQMGNPAPLMDVINSSFAEPWKIAPKVKKSSELTRLIDQYEVGQVPAGVVCLTAGIDVQVDRYIWEIRGWGRRMENWLIRKGESETADDLIQEVLLTSYQQIGGETLSVMKACIDSGYDTQNVYDLCRGIGRDLPDVLVPIKGFDNLPVREIDSTDIEVDPRGRRIPGGIRLYKLDTTKLKDALDRYLKGGDGDFGRVHLPRGTEQDYLDQLVSEAKMGRADKKSKKIVEVWEKVSATAQNHYWDTFVYALAAAKLIGVDKLPLDDEPKRVYKTQERNAASWVRPGQEADNDVGRRTSRESWVRR